ncbi:MAG TPA: hypothetical protein PLU10_06595 [Chitinophagaceae bacterium]|nr:hypothetical protein [Chitinophagaceae bacterium]
MTKKFFRVGFLSLLSLLFNIAHAQVPNFLPDTVTTYAIMGTTANVKEPITREVYSYNSSNQPLEKWMFQWNRETKKWDQKIRFSLQYFPLEIVIDKFVTEGKSQELQVQRRSIQLDSFKHIITATYLDKDRYSSQFEIREKYDYTYNKDTLVQIVKFAKKAIMMKDRETKYAWVKGNLSENTSIYKDAGDKESNQLTLHSYNKGLLVKSLSAGSSDIKIKWKDSLEYTDGMVSTVTKSRVSKLPNSSKNDILQEPIQKTKVVYDKKGVLVTFTSTKLSSKGEVITNPENRIYEYKLNPKRPPVKSRVNQVQLIDFLRD